MTFTFPPRNKVKSLHKRGPNTFECESCNTYVYEGTRTLEKQREILDLSDTTPLIKGKVHLDHKEPVIPIKGFKQTEWNWDEFITRLYCSEDGFSVLCAPCHKVKTDQENAQRREHKKSLTNSKK
jgi:hypothetical protein